MIRAIIFDWHGVLDTIEQVDTVKKISLKLSPNLSLWALLSSSLVTKYKLAILSDCPADKTSIIRGQVDLSIFDEVFFSSEVHKDKSSENFFLSLSEKLGAPPRETLYVDDTVKHIDFAKKLGYQTHHFKTVDEFRKNLLDK